MEPKQNRIC